MRGDVVPNAGFLERDVDLRKVILVGFNQPIGKRSNQLSSGTGTPPCS